MFAVYERDGWAQTDAFAAYGVCNLPLTPGFHDVEAHCWRANNRNARMSEEIAALFAGARAELDGWKRCVIRREELYASPAVTVGMGSVHPQHEDAEQGQRARSDLHGATDSTELRGRPQ